MTEQKVSCCPIRPNLQGLACRITCQPGQTEHRRAACTVRAHVGQPGLCRPFFFFPPDYLYSVTPVLKFLLGEKGTFLHCRWEWKLVHQLWKTLWKYFRKLYIELLYIATPLLGIYLHKTFIQKDNASLCSLQHYSK